MPLIVQKYGGSSLATPKLILRAARRIAGLKRAGRDVVVVASAMGRTTDHLIKLANKTVARPPKRELDMLMTAGERISMSLLAMALHQEGIPAISFTGSQSGIITTNDHTEARILEIRATRIRDELAKGKVVIIAGFQGVSAEKEITTLGRGGSDTSAVALAASLGAECCEILTDVDGLFSADPRIVADAKLISECSYDEALELASLGAKMHARSIEVAKRFHVRVRITSSAKPEGQGTLLVDGETKGEEMEDTIIRGIATKEGYSLFRCTSPLEKVISALDGCHVSLRFLSAGGSDVRFVVEKEKIGVVKEKLQEAGVPAEEMPKVAIVSAVGDGLSSSAATLPLFYQTLRECGAECLLLTSNSSSITAAIRTAHLSAAAQALHARFVK